MPMRVLMSDTLSAPSASTAFAISVTCHVRRELYDDWLVVAFAYGTHHAGCARCGYAESHATLLDRKSVV